MKSSQIKRIERIPVMMTIDERAEIEVAMSKSGISTISTYLRMLALREARKDNGRTK